jgi:hypothetical protein
VSARHVLETVAKELVVESDGTSILEMEGDEEFEFTVHCWVFHLHIHGSIKKCKE